MVDVMNVEDRKEVREMLTDIISGPLEKINGQFRLLVNQLSNIETQTLNTTGRVGEAEAELEILKLRIAKEIPHTIISCPQATTIETMKVDVDRLKNGKIVEKNLREKIQSNTNLILVSFGIIVALVVGLVNIGRNSKQSAEQVTMKAQIDHIVNKDSLLITH
jgi:hypothetical protein